MMLKLYPAAGQAWMLFAFLPLTFTQNSASKRRINDSLKHSIHTPSNEIPTHSAITIAAFSTINTMNKLTVNPFISGSIGSYYFENRYNYEAYNSASINLGRTLDKKIAGFAITPMLGLVVGGFQGVTSEIQAFRENERWYFSLDNQYTFEYTTPKRSFNYNWLVGRYKLTPFFRIGISTQFTKPINQRGVFDTALTTSFLYHNITFNIYAFNYETGKRNYLLSLRYYLKLN